MAKSILCIHCLLGAPFLFFYYMGPISQSTEAAAVFLHNMYSQRQGHLWARTENSTAARCVSAMALSIVPGLTRSNLHLSIHRLLRAPRLAAYPLKHTALWLRELHCCFSPTAFWFRTFFLFIRGRLAKYNGVNQKCENPIEPNGNLASNINLFTACWKEWPRAKIVFVNL